MKYTITVTKTLEDWWGVSDMEEAGYSDKQIIELIEEDITSFLENAKWKIKRIEQFPEDSKGDVMPVVNGVHVRCNYPIGVKGEICGCNVFRYTDPTTLKCNSCGGTFTVELSKR